jgi:hypothetical protein
MKTTDEGHQRYKSVMNMLRGAEKNERFLETIMFSDESTFEITGKMSQ